MRALLSLGLALVSTSSFAGGLPPDFNYGNWQKLVAQVIAKGDVAQTIDGESRSLTHLVPNDKTKPHQADYLTTSGAVDPKGKYHAANVSFVSENWTKDSHSDWDIDQQIYQLNLRGELTFAIHTHIVETDDGSVLADDTLPTGGSDDPATLPALGQKLGQWQGWAFE